MTWVALPRRTSRVRVRSDPDGTWAVLLPDGTWAVLLPDGADWITVPDRAALDRIVPPSCFEYIDAPKGVAS